MTSNIELVWTFMLDYTKGWGVRRHSHDYFQMYYCLEGEALFFLDGAELPLVKNDCLIIRPFQIHELYPISSGHLRIIDTKFYIHESDLYQSILEVPSVVPIAENGFRELQQGLRGEWASGAPYSKIMATLLFEQCLYLCLRHGSTFSTDAPFYHDLEHTISRLSGLEQKIAEYIAEHYWENITLDHLAHDLRYSKNYLCKVFKAAAGITISEYVNFLKIRKAYDLVCYSDQKLTEIAVNCGFSSIHYFSRIFHKYVGMAPSQVRDQDRNTLNTDIRLHGTFRYRYYSPSE